MRIITEPKELIARYVSRIQHKTLDLDAIAAIGLLNAEEELVAGAVFNGYAPPNILMHIALEYMTPAFVSALMYYPFVQLKCGRVTGVIEQQNLHARQFTEHMGGVLEGTMIKAAPNGDNYCIYGLQADVAAKWLSPRYTRKLERAFA